MWSWRSFWWSWGRSGGPGGQTLSPPRRFPDEENVKNHKKGEVPTRGGRGGGRRDLKGHEAVVEEAVVEEAVEPPPGPLEP